MLAAGEQGAGSGEMYMTRLSWILAYFPTAILVLVIAAFLYLCVHPGVFSVLSLFFVLYGLPLLVYRLHNYFYPVTEGISYLQGQNYSPWWGSHQLQAIYIAIPTLEAILRLVPGLFSVWLRLWGAKVGQQVYWTPALEIADRSLLEIGDRVIFGHRTGLYAHVVKPRRGNLTIYVKKIEIGSDAFIGAGSVLGPGVAIADGAFLPAGTQVYLNQQVKSCDRSFKASEDCSHPLPIVSPES
jgi:hypothetical protein